MGVRGIGFKGRTGFNCLKIKCSGGFWTFCWTFDFHESRQSFYEPSDKFSCAECIIYGDFLWWIGRPEMINVLDILKRNLSVLPFSLKKWEKQVTIGIRTKHLLNDNRRFTAVLTRSVAWLTSSN
jgi:hypothetical protein